MRAMIVTADSIADYLSRYYKPERRTPSLTAHYEAELSEYGYVMTAPHDNVTGALIYWPGHPRHPGAAPFVPVA